MTLTPASKLIILILFTGLAATAFVLESVPLAIGSATLFGLLVGSS